jgi:hypothetical protein
MARTGLRMMPTFPSSPLSFRTAGFPQYGCKAGFSDTALAHAVPVKPAPGMPGLANRFACALRASYVVLLESRSCVGKDDIKVAPPCEESSSSAPEALAPVWVMVSQSIYAYSASSAPLAGTSGFHH